MVIPSPTKEVLRLILKEKRNRLTAEEKKEASLKITTLFFKLYSDPLPCLLYSPIWNEVETELLFHELQQKKIDVYFPRVVEKDVHFHQVNSLSELKQGPWCLEPSNTTPRFPSLQKAIVIVPGLGFTAQGHRLGYGKGYYDSFLKETPYLLRIGFAYSFQIVFQKWDNHAHDQRMDWVITPSAIWGSPRPQNS